MDYVDHFVDVAPFEYPADMLPLLPFASPAPAPASAPLVPVSDASSPSQSLPFCSARSVASLLPASAASSGIGPTPTPKYIGAPDAQPEQPPSDDYLTGLENEDWFADCCSEPASRTDRPAAHSYTGAVDATSAFAGGSSARAAQQSQLQLALDEDSSRSSHASLPPAPAVRDPTGGRRLTLQLRADSSSSNSNSSSAFGITAALQEKQASGSQLQPSLSVLQITASTAGRAAAVVPIREPALQRSAYFASPTAAVAVAGAVPAVTSFRNSSNQKNASLSGADSLSVSVLGASASRLQLELAGDSSSSADASHHPAHSPASPSRAAPLRGHGRVAGASLSLAFASPVGERVIASVEPQLSPSPIRPPPRTRRAFQLNDSSPNEDETYTRPG